MRAGWFLFFVSVSLIGCFGSGGASVACDKEDPPSGSVYVYGYVSGPAGALSGVRVTAEGSGVGSDDSDARGCYGMIARPSGQEPSVRFDEQGRPVTSGVSLTLHTKIVNYADAAVTVSGLADKEIRRVDLALRPL